MNGRSDVIVIGAGVNGLTAAALLAAAGRHVTVVERRPAAGGLAASEEFHPGYRTPGILHDTTGLRRSVVAALGLDGEGLRLAPEPPSVFVPSPGGGGLLLHHDPARAETGIAGASPADAAAYREHRAFIERIRGAIEPVLDGLPPDLYARGLADFRPFLGRAVALRRLGGKTLTEILRVAPMCVADWLNERFESELLKTAMAQPALTAMFAGPWSPGTAANLLLWESTARGGALGGAWTVARALEGAARAQGVELRLGASVEEVLIEEGRACGVRLAGGETLPAGAVAASCDPRRALLALVPGRYLPHRLESRMRSYRGSGTAAKVHLALSGLPEFAGREGEPFAWVRVGDSLDDLEKAFDPVKYRELGTQFMLEAYAPTLEAPELAPPGGHVLSVLVHFVPYGLEGGWTPSRRQELGDRVVAQLARYAPGLPGKIVGREVLTPVDLEERFGLVQGHLHHGDHALDQLLLRPAPECARFATPIPGLFLCGSGSHPGGGITGGPGALAARAIAGTRIGT
jgi:phytoene dehydrogenase-like protein